MRANYFFAAVAGNHRSVQSVCYICFKAGWAAPHVPSLPLRSASRAPGHSPSGARTYSLASFEINYLEVVLSNRVGPLENFSSRFVLTNCFAIACSANRDCSAFLT